MACGPDGGGGGTEDGSGSGSGTDASPTTSTTNTTNDPTSTSNGSADGTGSTTAVDTGSSGPEATTDPGTTTTEVTGSSDGGSSGEPPPESYPGCMADEDCSDPYTLCWPPMEFGTPNFCTVECMDAGECPVPTSGTATPACEGPPGMNICALDCSEGECPDGMSCVDVFGNGMFMRCTRM
jgi:hypothetical protein